MVRQWNDFVKNSAKIPDLGNKPYINVDSNDSVLFTSQRCILRRRKLSINIDLNNGTCVAACVFCTLHPPKKFRKYGKEFKGEKSLNSVLLYYLKLLSKT